MQVLVGRKGVRGLSLAGPGKVPRGFGLRTGDCGGDTADGAWNRSRPASGARIAGRNWKPNRGMDFYFFLRYDSLAWPGWAKGRMQNGV